MNLKTKLILAALSIIPAYTLRAVQGEDGTPPDYLEYVTMSADNLLKHGTDRYGKRKTAIWASIIDTRDNSVPEYGVPATAGVRSHDRA